MHKTIFKLAAILLIILAASILSSCEKQKKRYDYSVFAFGTLIDITFYNVEKQRAEKAFIQLQNNFDNYHQQWSPWTNGDLAKLNQVLKKKAATGESITVPKHLIPLIKESMQLSHESDGLYNPAIGNLINLWQFHKYQDADIKPPADGDIQQLLKANPQINNLSFSEKNKVINSNPAVLLNFGAFAKGYAIALEIEKLKQQGIHHAIINAGGDLSVIGKHGKRPWNIGIRHPREDSILASAEVKDNESIFTSGDYERFYTYENHRFHHILNPETGYPTEDTQSVTVIHHDAGRADAAATALSVAGSKKWHAIAKKMNIKHVMLIDAKGNIHLTPEMQKRIKLLNKAAISRIILSKAL